jgi:hypothetical protein
LRIVSVGMVVDEDGGVPVTDGRIDGSAQMDVLQAAATHLHGRPEKRGFAKLAEQTLILYNSDWALVM